MTVIQTSLTTGSDIPDHEAPAIPTERHPSCLFSLSCPAIVTPDRRRSGADLDVARITGDDLADDQRGLSRPHVGYVQSG